MTDDAIIYNEQLTHSQNPERMTTKRRGETLPFYRDRGQTPAFRFSTSQFFWRGHVTPIVDLRIRAPWRPVQSQRQKKQNVLPSFAIIYRVNMNMIRIDAKKYSPVLIRKPLKVIRILAPKYPGIEVY